MPSTRQDSGYAIAPWPRGETRIIIFILIFATSLLVLREDNIWWGGGILGLICWAALIIGSAGVPRLQPCHIFLFSAMTENKDIKIMLMRLPSAVLVVINILKGITRNKLEDNDAGGDISAIISDLSTFQRMKIFAFSVFFVIVTPSRHGDGEGAISCWSLPRPGTTRLR